MRTKLVLIALSVFLAMMFIITSLLGGVGVSIAQQDDHRVYLPIVAKPPCDSTGPTAAYISTNRPVVKVGEMVTVTGAIVSDGCPFEGSPVFYIYSNPAGILQPTLVAGSFDPIQTRTYRETYGWFHAMSTGPVTFTMLINARLTGSTHQWIESSPVMIRVLPSQ